MAAEKSSTWKQAAAASTSSDRADDSTMTQATLKTTAPDNITQNPRKKSYLHSIFSLSTLSSLAALFYVYMAFSNFLNMMYPLRNIPRDVLNSIPDDRKVYPFWNWQDNRIVRGKEVLGLRVYLSSRQDFSLDYFSENDQFSDGTSDNDDGEIDGEVSQKVIRNGQSFLIWSEDNALEATKKFPSRSFVIATSDNPSESTACNSSRGMSCSRDEAEKFQKSISFAQQWLKDAIQHEKQLELDGGGLMAAMNSAGGGIESTSVLLTLYTSILRNITDLIRKTKDFFSPTHSNDERNARSDVSKQSNNENGDEPQSIIYISPQNSVWKSLMSNGTAYVHVLLVRQSSSQLISSSPNARSAANHLQQLHSQHNVLFGRVGMIKRELPLHVPSPKRLLYRDLLFAIQRYAVCPFLGSNDGNSCSSMVPPWNVAYHQPQTHAEYQLARQHKKDGVKYPYWKPEVSIHLIQEQEGYPIDYANRVGFEIVRTGNNKRHLSGYGYLPAVHVDEIGLTSDKYIPLNETVSAVPLRIGFHSGMSQEEGEPAVISQQGITPARYRLLNHMSSSLESQAEMGFEQSDIDDLRRLIAETNVVLLAVTILASVLHLLFEFLTFKSDVDFWRSNTDLTGLSVRALFLDWLSQVVILLYLIEMDSSLLMTVPTGVGMLIALWKCQRGAGLKFVKINSKESGKQTRAWYNKVLGILGFELRATRLRAAASASRTSGKKISLTKQDLAALTEEMDQLATNLLGKYFLLPLVVSYAIYSLLNEQHSGWYSWFITTASSFVYAIGFVLMTPQLFLNYKLKSVAHLPWRVLGYRFVNTFIDDLFAFIIRMPTMARMSCFRDDVVFIIYLWQRYLYPVDRSRPVEGGAVGDVTPNAAPLQDSSTEGAENKKQK
mmetsp:Transcript_2437/g.5281  ORF Transcript_2437/g.5281 Transcript_2437/m.5281 type:complete len:891 (-) Transcript_2437:57-2729(-)